MAMKFRAHDTFFIRKGWLSKGMRQVVANDDVFVTKDKSRNPMDVLGIGANMVKSLRYWLQAIGLTKETNKGMRVQKLTDFGELVYQNDHYTEELGTLWLLQYQLAKNANEATAWYFFFNEFNMTEFSRDDYIQSLQNYITMKEETAAVRSLSEDFSCIINTYLPRYKSNPGKISPENNIDCPFGELGLVDILNKDGKNTVYKKSIPSVDTINPWVGLAIIYAQAGDSNEIGLNTLLTEPCNIGKVFNLDSITMLELLRRIEKTDLVKIVRTAGLDYVKLEQGHTFYECVNRYYKEIVQ